MKVVRGSNLIETVWNYLQLKLIRQKFHFMRNEMLWKRIKQQENGNAVFIPFSPTTLEYFLYFQKAAIKLFPLINILFPLRDTVSYKLADRPHGHGKPHTQAQSTEPHKLQVRWYSYRVTPALIVKSRKLWPRKSSSCSLLIER